MISSSDGKNISSNRWIATDLGAQNLRFAKAAELLDNGAAKISVLSKSEGKSSIPSLFSIKNGKRQFGVRARETNAANIIADSTVIVHTQEKQRQHQKHSSKKKEKLSFKEKCVKLLNGLANSRSTITGASVDHTQSQQDGRNDEHAHLMEFYAPMADDGCYHLVDEQKQICLLKIEAIAALLANIRTSIFPDILTAHHDVVEFELVNAVIVVPSFAHHHYRQIVRQAALIAGFSTVHLLNQSVAVAIAFQHQNLNGNALGGQEVNNNLVAIVNIGAQSTECSILDFNYAMPKLLAAQGCVDFGGANFTEALFNWAIQEARQQFGCFASEAQQQLLHNLWHSCEKAKKALAFDDDTCIQFFDGTEDRSIDLELETFERICVVLFDKLKAIFHEALSDLGGEKPGAILLAGGSTRLQRLKHILADITGPNCPILSVSANVPEEMAIHGAALKAAWLNHKDNGNKVPYSFVRTTMDDFDYREKCCCQEPTQFPQLLNIERVESARKDILDYEQGIRQANWEAKRRREEELRQKEEAWRRKKEAERKRKLELEEEKRREEDERERKQREEEEAQIQLEADEKKKKEEFEKAERKRKEWEEAEEKRKMEEVEQKMEKEKRRMEEAERKRKELKETERKREKQEVSRQTQRHSISIALAYSSRIYSRLQIPVFPEFLTKWCGNTFISTISTLQALLALLCPLQMPANTGTLGRRLKPLTAPMTDDTDGGGEQMEMLCDSEPQIAGSTASACCCEQGDVGKALSLTRANVLFSQINEDMEAVKSEAKKMGLWKKSRSKHPLLAKIYSLQQRCCKPMTNNTTTTSINSSLSEICQEAERFWTIGRALEGMRNALELIRKHKSWTIEHFGKYVGKGSFPLRKAFLEELKQSRYEISKPALMELFRNEFAAKVQAVLVKHGNKMPKEDVDKLKAICAETFLDKYSNMLQIDK